MPLLRRGFEVVEVSWWALWREEAERLGQLRLFEGEDEGAGELVGEVEGEEE